MPPRGRAGRKLAAINHGRSLPADMVSLWATQVGERVLLLGPFVELDGRAWVYRPGQVHDAFAYLVTGPAAGNVVEFVTERINLDKELRRAAAGVWRLGGETAVATMLMDAVPPGPKHSKVINLPTFYLPNGNQQWRLGNFPQCGHRDMSYDRLTINMEGYKSDAPFLQLLPRKP